MQKIITAGPVINAGVGYNLFRVVVWCEFNSVGKPTKYVVHKQYLLRDTRKFSLSNGKYFECFNSPDKEPGEDAKSVRLRVQTVDANNKPLGDPSYVLAPVTAYGKAHAEFTKQNDESLRSYGPAPLGDLEFFDECLKEVGHTKVTMS